MQIQILTMSGRCIDLDLEPAETTVKDVKLRLQEELELSSMESQRLLVAETE